jgi:cellulose synthase/poly-beta-1,6-N-acetylglucosamine synthase-like glycosyltransferase
MAELFAALLLATGAFYLGMVLWLAAGLRRNQAARVAGLPRISVVVAARNEEGTIGACLDALQAQDYEGELEVVVVDDRSEDQTAQRVKARGWAGLKLVRVVGQPRFRCPKKNALAAGIEESRGELLLFTDADCRPAPDWVRRTAALFHPEVGLAAGHAFPEPVQGLGQALLALDNLAVGALGAGSIGMGRPLSCTGRNLAYRRQVYEEVGGFASIGHLIGGDDVYFLRLVTRSSWRVARNPTLVSCAPGPRTWGAALQQKLRHAAKAGHYGGAALLAGGVIYGFHLLLLAGLVRLILGEPDPVFLGVWAGRWLGDLFLLAGYAPRQSERRLLGCLPFLEVLYIPYVLFFTLAGRLGWFRWK